MSISPARMAANHANAGYALGVSIGDHDLLASFTTHYTPNGPAETLLVHRIVAASLRIDLLERALDALLELGERRALVDHLSERFVIDEPKVQVRDQPNWAAMIRRYDGTAEAPPDYDLALDPDPPPLHPRLHPLWPSCRRAHAPRSRCRMPSVCRYARIASPAGQRQKERNEPIPLSRMHGNEPITRPAPTARCENEPITPCSPAAAYENEPTRCAAAVGYKNEPITPAATPVHILPLLSVGNEPNQSLPRTAEMPPVRKEAIAPSPLSAAHTALSDVRKNEPTTPLPPDPLAYLLHHTGSAHDAVEPWHAGHLRRSSSADSHGRQI